MYDRTTYDAAGNMTVLSSGGTAKYDAWNRLVEVDALSSEEEITSTYAYDGTGRRVRETVETRYIQHPMVSLDQHDDYYQGQQVVETRGGDGDVEYQNLWSPRYIDAMILRDTYSGGDLVLADRVFYLADANYNVTGLMKYNSDYGEWDIVERYAYTPYGAVTYFDHYWDEAEDQTGSAYGNTTLFADRTLDLLTTLYYNRARYYDATLERFINRDPMESSPNLYAYCDDDPVIYVDPLGLYDLTGGSGVPGPVLLSPAWPAWSAPSESGPNISIPPLLGEISSGIAGLLPPGTTGTVPLKTFSAPPILLPGGATLNMSVSVEGSVTTCTTGTCPEKHKLMFCGEVSVKIDIGFGAMGSIPGGTSSTKGKEPSSKTKEPTSVKVPVNGNGEAICQNTLEIEAKAYGYFEAYAGAGFRITGELGGWSLSNGWEWNPHTTDEFGFNWKVGARVAIVIEGTGKGCVVLG